MVGRTPRSAADPLVGSFPENFAFIAHY